MKTARKNKKRVLQIGITVVMCVIFLLSLFVFIRSFLPVQDFVMMGLSQYTPSDIITATGFEVGDKLYSLDLKEAEKTLLENYHYIEEIKIERKFPNKLVFYITEKLPSWYIAVSGSYYTLDGEFMIIDESASREQFANLGVPQIVLPNLKSAVVGSLPEFGKDETEIRRALELVSQINASMLKSRITLVDIESRFDISIVVDGKYSAYLGGMENIPEKLEAMKTLLDSGKIDKYSAAEIYLADPANPSVKPIYE